MKIFERQSSNIFSIPLLALLLIGLWVTFAPVQLGGQTTYVIVSGNSMEPDFHLGDLAIVRQSEVYEIGDIVTYRNAELGKSVIHRIIGLAQDHFILKGDNNSWIDSYQPTQAEMIGKLWIFIPSMGKAIEWVRTPINMAIIVAMMGGLVMTSTLTNQRQRGKNIRQTSTNLGWIEISVLVVGVLLLLFLFLGILSFTRPTSHAIANASYQQVGMFYYSAAGTTGVYDSNTVHSGEPIFPKLTCLLNLGFGYSLTGDLMEDISGTQQLSAKITDDQSGWQRTIPMKAYTPFSGSSFSSSAALDLCEIETLVDAVEKETGFHPSTYTLSITPDVAVAWKIGEQEFHDTFLPRLIFKFDKLHFYLARDNEQADPLYFSKKNVVNVTGYEDSTLSLFGLEFRVIDVRVVAILGLFVLLVTALLIASYIYNVGQHNQVLFIRLRYGSMLIDVYDNGLETLSPVIEATTIDDLAKIAERQNAIMLHMVRDSLHFYFVHNNGTTYRYVVRNRETLH